MTGKVSFSGWIESSFTWALPTAPSASLPVSTAPAASLPVSTAPSASLPLFTAPSASLPFLTASGAIFLPVTAWRWMSLVAILEAA